MFQDCSGFYHSQFSPDHLMSCREHQDLMIHMIKSDAFQMNQVSVDLKDVFIPNDSSVITQNALQLNPLLCSHF